MRLAKGRREEIKYLLLDVHGVLTVPGARKRFLPYMERRYGMDLDKHSEMFVQHLHSLDRGTYDQKAYLKLINRTFNTGLSVKEYYRVLGRFGRLNEAFIRRLRNASVRMCIVSDDSPPMSTSLLKKFRQRLRLYRAFYSYQYGRCKDAGLIKDVLRELGARPGECLFVDDREVNVSVAKRMGMDAVLFTTNRKLFADLRKHGIRL